jgi:hypothetical protein
MVTVDLPGRPGAPMAAHQVSLDLNRDTVVQALNGVSGRAILADHSFAGTRLNGVQRRTFGVRSMGRKRRCARFRKLAFRSCPLSGEREESASPPFADIHRPWGRGHPPF